MEQKEVSRQELVEEGNEAILNSILRDMAATDKDLAQAMGINTKHPGGRPSIYSPELVEKICDRISQGESLRKICRDDGMPHISTVMDWLNDPNKKEFVEQYARARNVQAEVLFDELLEIADDDMGDFIHVENKDGEVVEKFNKEAVMRSRLRVDTRKWYLSKVLPKKYGDKIDVTSDGKKLDAGNKIVLVDFNDSESQQEV